MKPQLSVWTSYYYEKNPEEAVLEFKKHGITASELSDEHGALLLDRGNPKEVGAAFGAFLREQNYTMTQGHLLLRCKICTREGDLEKLKDWIDLYEAIGIKNAVLHVDGMVDQDVTEEERFRYNLDKLKQLEAYILENHYDLCICLENLRASNRSVEEINAYMEQLDETHFGICLDTGHLNLVENKDQKEFIRKAGKRLRALHIADNQGKEIDEHMMPFGRGNVDFVEVVRALKEVDYQGLFNLEIPGENHRPDEILGYKLEYICKCYEYLMEQM